MLSGFSLSLDGLNSAVVICLVVNLPEFILVGVIWILGFFGGDFIIYLREGECEHVHVHTGTGRDGGGSGKESQGVSALSVDPSGAHAVSVS